MMKMRLIASWPSCFAYNAGAQTILTPSWWRQLHRTLLSLHACRLWIRAKDRNLHLQSISCGIGSEQQLGRIEKEGDETRASERINKTLEKVSVAPSKNTQNLLGSIGDVDLKRESGLLIVTTQVGIVCEEDESAYVYKRLDGKWQRIWESEQNDYQKYTPQHINAVHIWQSYEDGKQSGPAYILTLGNEWGCASAWHQVYYRIWRVDSSGSKSLVDQSGDGYLRGQSYIVGSISNSPMHFNGPVDAIIEFTQRSVDGTVHNRRNRPPLPDREENSSSSCCPSGPESKRLRGRVDDKPVAHEPRVVFVTRSVHVASEAARRLRRRRLPREYDALSDA